MNWRNWSARYEFWGNQVKSQFSLPRHHVKGSSQTADTRCKVLIDVVYPVEMAVMLSQIWPEIELALSKLGWNFPLSGALNKCGIFSVVTPDDEGGTSSEMYSEGVSVLRGHNLYIYDIAPGYIPAFWACDLWVGGCVPPITATVCVCVCAKSTVKGACLSPEPAARWCWVSPCSRGWLRINTPWQ